MSAHLQPEAQADGLSRLTPRHRRAVVGLLRPRAPHNAYLLAQIARGALARDDVAGPLLGHWRGGELDGICVFGSNLVLSARASDAAVAAFAEYALRSRFRMWVTVGEDDTVDRFMAAYGRERRGIHIERGGQRLYALRQADLDPARASRTPLLRPADVSELRLVMHMDRAMVQEELGFDPFALDLDSYRSGWIRRLREGRCWVVGVPGGGLQFKVDQSASSDEVVQLAGIYTTPGLRRQGLGRAGVGEVCERLLREVPVVTLYVHQENRAAIALYEALGFRHIGHVRSVWFDPP